MALPLRTPDADPGPAGRAPEALGGAGELERLEIELLLEALHRHHDYDFRGFALESLRPRLWRRVRAEGARTIAGLLERVLHDPACHERLLAELSVSVTAMFRDPPFFAALRAAVLPGLRTYPFVRVWVAGCSSGEEVYSLAILLHEAGLLARTRIYATDVNPAVLERAATRRYPRERLGPWADAYRRSGGTGELSSYLAVDGDEIELDPALAAPVVLARHNLIVDRSFNEFHLIVCRNVLIYLSRAGQQVVHDLFLQSLVPLGVLGLGPQESLRSSGVAGAFRELDAAQRLYRRVG